MGSRSRHPWRQPVLNMAPGWLSLRSLFSRVLGLVRLQRGSPPGGRLRPRRPPLPLLPHGSALGGRRRLQKLGAGSGRQVRAKDTEQQGTPHRRERENGSPDPLCYQSRERPLVGMMWGDRDGCSCERQTSEMESRTNDPAASTEWLQSASTNYLICWRRCSPSPATNKISVTSYRTWLVMADRSASIYALQRVQG